ncbi:class I SAM-dependent methyltransferase [Saccharothrix xinjiangensis]|uniref:Class I SAM-dependent methyltransferase n=1 Tax=Saccharothrix xinjiangensis TaxID=204798 RepID=A0ABV9Y6A3_9PSEU
MTVERAALDAFEVGSAEFAEWAPLLWDPIGAEAVGITRPRPGERVLDVCCGTGSSAVPAARAVGPDGRVDAVDLAPTLLRAGARHAADLPQLRFHHADATRWSPGDGLPYDRVQCVFGIFFLPDMDAAAARLAGLLRPGGTLTAVTWRQGSLDDVLGPLGRAVTEHTGTPPTRPQAALQAARLDTGERLAEWLRDLGLAEVTVHEVAREVPITPELAWKLVVGSGARAALAGLDAGAVAAVRDRYHELVAPIAVLRARALVGVGERRS